MNQSMYNLFNYTWTIINNMSVSVGNISITLNCSDPQNAFDESVCGYVKRIENNTIEINTTVNVILNLVQYINGTRWGNLTAWDIYQKIQPSDLKLGSSYY